MNEVIPKMYHVLRDFPPEISEEEIAEMMSRFESATTAHWALVSDIGKMTVDAVKRHHQKHVENIERLDLTPGDKKWLYETVGNVEHVGESIYWLGMKAAHALDDSQHDKITLEVLGENMFGRPQTHEIDTTPARIEQQVQEYGSILEFNALYTSGFADNRYYIYPYYDDPYRDNFNYNKCRLVVRWPIADLTVRNAAHVNIFRQREIMLALDHTDSSTHETISEIGSRAWEYEDEHEYREFAVPYAITGGLAYERFYSEEPPFYKDIYPIRDQILARAIQPNNSTNGSS